jgi:hypothetical protein
MRTRAETQADRKLILDQILARFGSDGQFHLEHLEPLPGFATLSVKTGGAHVEAVYRVRAHESVEAALAYFASDSDFQPLEVIGLDTGLSSQVQPQVSYVLGDRGENYGTTSSPAGSAG